MRGRLMDGNCLPGKALWALAIEVTGGDVPVASWRSTLSGDMLTRLFDSDARIVQEHLEACVDCRERLEHALRSIELYRQELKSPFVRDAAREIINAAINEQGIVLRFAPYVDAEAMPIAMAAQTSEARAEPLRFCSDGEDILLKEVEAPASSANKRLFLLLATDPELARGATAILCGVEYAADEMGYIDFRDAAGDINEDSEFIIRPRREFLA